MKNFKRNFYILLAFSFLACIVLAWYAYNQNVRVNEKESQIEALTDTVTIYKTKDGKNAAYIKILKGSKSEVVNAAKSDPRIAAVIKSTDGIKSFTEVKIKTVRDTVVRVDTIRLQTATQPLFLVKNIKDEFSDTKITVSGDSLRLEQVNYESLDFITKEKSNGLFKPRSYVTDVSVRNKKTVVVGLKSFEITPKTNTGLKISIGLVAGVGAFLLLK